jgi:hypothetical protein
MRRTAEQRHIITDIVRQTAGGYACSVRGLMTPRAAAILICSSN